MRQTSRISWRRTARPCASLVRWQQGWRQHNRQGFWQTISSSDTEKLETKLHEWMHEADTHVVTCTNHWMTSSNGNLLVPPCHDTLNSRLYRIEPQLNTRPRCRKKHDNGELPVGKMLLISQILICRNQKVVALLFR